MTTEETKSVQIAIRLYPSQYRQIQRIAEIERREEPDMIRYMLDEFILNYRKLEVAPNKKEARSTS